MIDLPLNCKPVTRRTGQFGLHVAMLAASFGANLAIAEDRENCLLCHRYPGLSRFDPEAGRVRLFYIDPSYAHHGLGPHSRLACTDCHGREEVGVVPHGTVRPVDCLRQCHIVDPNGGEKRFSHANVARMLEQGVHTAETLSKLEFTGGPLLEAGQSQCLYCHDEPVFRDPRGMNWAGAEGPGFDRCDACHGSQIRIDVSYYYRHVAARLSPARSTLEIAQVCAICHSDPKVLEQHELPNSVASFVRSFHGKAALLGDTTTASCLSCHVNSGENAHLMLGPKHPESSVYVDRIADSCRSTDCHPGADKGIAATAVHLDLPTARDTLEFFIALGFIFITIISFAPSALIVVLELAQLVVGRKHHESAHVRVLARQLMADPEGRRRLTRFSVGNRVQHWMLTALFVALVLTGFPLKFADQTWAAATITLFGGIQVARVIHHWSGIALVVGFLVHLTFILWRMWETAQSLEPNGKKKGIWHAFWNLPAVVNWTDAKKAAALVAYLVGLRKERPTFGRFSATEKFEYFGVLWGTSLLGLTGLMLWGEQITSHFLGGRVFNIATIVHTYEAFLALIHVGILHIYNVVLAPAVFPLSLATLTGQTPLAKLAEEHGDLVLETAKELGIAVEELTDD